MSTFRELFLEQLIEDARDDQPDIDMVLAIQEVPEMREPAEVRTTMVRGSETRATGIVHDAKLLKPAKVRIIMQNAEEEMFFFDYDGTFSDMLLEMLNPGLVESST